MSKKLAYNIFTEEMNDALHAMEPHFLAVLPLLNPSYDPNAALERKQEEEKERQLYITAVDNLKKRGVHRTMSVMSDEFEDLIDAEMDSLR